MLKVTKCLGVKYFVEALINMVCELKITSGCKKMCKNFMVIRHSIKELLAKSMVTRPMKCIVDTLDYFTGIFLVVTTRIILVKFTSMFNWISEFLVGAISTRRFLCVNNLSQYSQFK